eukprot:6176025-Pleurochrysis_carterae.AAC.1
MERAMCYTTEDSGAVTAKKNTHVKQRAWTDHAPPHASTDGAWTHTSIAPPKDVRSPSGRIRSAFSYVQGTADELSSNGHTRAASRLSVGHACKRRRPRRTGPLARLLGRGSL